MSQSQPAVVIGPTASGKTNLIALLAHAASQQSRDDPRLTCEFRPANKLMAERAAQARDLILKGEWANDGTEGLDDFEFEFRVKAKGGMLSQAKAKHFQLRDSRGGLLFGPRSAEQAEASMRDSLIEALVAADGIIICADATNRPAAATREPTSVAFAAHFPTILAEIGLRKLHCRRVVFCLTKVERVVRDYGHYARQRAEQANPATYCRRLIGEANVGLLKSYLQPDAEVMAGWSSIFGFRQDTGESNTVVGGDSERAAAVLDDLRPFRLQDPFIFLTSGDPMALTSLYTDEENRERRVRRMVGALGRKSRDAKQRIDAMRASSSTAEKTRHEEPSSHDTEGTRTREEPKPPESSTKPGPHATPHEEAAPGSDNIRF